MMHTRLPIFTLTILLASVALGRSDDDGFRPLFNGEDLSGWVRVNTAPSTWRVEDGLLICSGKPIGELRTNRMYQNFVLELEWRHMVPKGNAGVFVWADDITARGVPFHRSIEVQVLENAYGNSRSHTTHGDIFPIHGATMEPINGRGGQRAFPTENRSKPSPEWNHYQITCNDGDISLAVNGKVVTRGTNSSLRKGYICLESEGGIVHYRGLRIRELPATPIAAEQIAIADRGYRCLYTGLDLTGWTTDSQDWQAKDWVLSHTGKGTASLTSAETFGDVGFLFDLRRKEASQVMTFSLRDTDAAVIIDPADPVFAKHLSKPGRWNRFEGSLIGNRLRLSVNGTPLIDRTINNAPANGPLRFSSAGPADLANIYVRKSPSDSAQ